MKSVSRYKKSASSTNVWLFDFCLIASLCPFLNVVNGTSYFTYLLMSLSIAKLVFKLIGSFSGADRAQEKHRLLCVYIPLRNYNVSCIIKIVLLYS